MALKDTLLDLGKSAAIGAGNLLIDAADSSFFKAENSSMDEGQDRTPGGSSADSAANAPVPTQAATDDPKSLFWDPYAIIEQMGYKDKYSPINYGTLKAMVWKSPVVTAIINTRLNQMASFSSPQKDKYSLGFRLKLRESEKEPTRQDKIWMRQMETIIERTGVTDNPRGRDTFETFLRKAMWDSLVYDAMAWEIVPNRGGQPAEWYAVDASSIRVADNATLYDTDEDDTKATRYVQIYDSMIIGEYTQEEMCYGIRNPRTDMRQYGYGTSELEMMVTTITSMLWGMEYNMKAFSQGSVHKGILNFKGAIPDKQMKAFRRHWYQMLSGVENAFRTPVTNAEDLQWINMHSSNRDMEYNAWMDFLIKVACSVYSIDPMEVNFQYGNTGAKSSLNEGSNRFKIVESRERGLRPLLRFVASCMNKHILWPINEDFEFEFVGLDTLTREQAADLHTKQVKTILTIDELRAREDLPPLPDGQGEIILDPTFLQAKQAAEMAAQGGDFGAEGGEEEPDFASLLGDDEDDQDQDQPEQEQQKSLMAPKRNALQKSGNIIIDVEL